MAHITFLEATAESSAANGNITLNAPSSPQTDDVWIAVIHSSDQVAHTLTDWTQIVQGNGGGTTSRLSVWYFRYAGSTPNLIVGHTAGQSPIGGIAALRGVKKTGSPVNVAGTISGGTDGTIEHAAITPTIAGCIILACNGSADDNNRTINVYTPRFEDIGGGVQNAYHTTAGNPDGSVALHTNSDPTPNVSTGIVTDTQAAADAWTSVLIAIEPEPTVVNGQVEICSQNHINIVSSVSIGNVVSILLGEMFTNVFGGRILSDNVSFIVSVGLLNTENTLSILGVSEISADGEIDTVVTRSIVGTTEISNQGLLENTYTLMLAGESTVIGVGFTVNIGDLVVEDNVSIVLGELSVDLAAQLISTYVLARKTTNDASAFAVKYRITQQM